jgi:hypothetical protein
MAGRRLTHCCCFSVRTGSLILASLAIAAGAIEVVIAAAALGNQDAVHQALYQFRSIYDEYYKQGQISGQQLDQVDHLLGMIRTSLIPLLALYLTCGIFKILVNGLMAFGVQTRRPTLFLPWLILVMLTIVVNGGCILASTVFDIINSHAASGFINLAFGSIMLLLVYYIWLVVFSHFQALKEQVCADHQRLARAIDMKSPEQVTDEKKPPGHTYTEDPPPYEALGGPPPYEDAVGAKA